MKDPGRVVIVGAGPTGLGAARRFEELGFHSWVLVDRTREPGGLARSAVDDHGFTWDIGGHVQFSHYDYYDALCDAALGDAWLSHERDASIWIRGRFVPYPLQNNLHHLDPHDCERALCGLEGGRSNGRQPANFAEWIRSTFGAPLAGLFFEPYNHKVWGHPLHEIGTGWMGDRVAVPDVAALRQRARDRVDDASWGPNSTFRYPLRSGSGSLWQAVARALPADRVTLGAEVVSISLNDRAVWLRDGRRLPWDTLVSTMPLDLLCTRVAGLAEDVRAAAASLLHSAVHVLGIGLRGPRPEALARKCWMYFPEPASPYYRVTVFSNYSPHHVPTGHDYWSLMAEVCETVHRPVHADAIGRETVAALRRDGLIPDATCVVSLWHHAEEHGYPTPSVRRDEALATVFSALEPHRIFSRGRFGAWKYEVSNQDHSCMQGVELADRLLGIGAGDEPTLHRPAAVNRGMFAARARTA